MRLLLLTAVFAGPAVSPSAEPPHRYLDTVQVAQAKLQGPGVASWHDYGGTEWERKYGKHVCAHWTHPKGSRWRIHYGGRSVVVTVGDRGPHPRLKREWDLSRKAFAKLAPTSKGLIKVQWQRA